jgi:hypothetical protein
MGELTNEEIVKMIGLLKSIKPQSLELKTIIQKLQQQLK